MSTETAELSSVSLRLPKDLVQRVSDLAKKTGRTRTFYMQQAIEQHLEDLEDFYEAEQALMNLALGKSKLIDLEDVMKKYGMEN